MADRTSVNQTVRQLEPLLGGSASTSQSSGFAMGEGWAWTSVDQTGEGRLEIYFLARGSARKTTGRLSAKDTRLNNRMPTGRKGATDSDNVSDVAPRFEFLWRTLHDKRGHVRRSRPHRGANTPGPLYRTTASEAPVGISFVGQVPCEAESAKSK